LLWHYWRWGALLAGAPLLIFGVTEMILSYRENSQRLGQIQRAEARAAEGKITEYLAAIERSVRDSASLAFGLSMLGEEERRDEFARLLRLLPPVLELTAVDSRGQEVLFISRSEPDRVGSQRSVQEPGVDSPRSQTLRYGAPSFAEGFDPVVLLSVPGFEPTAPRTLAKLNLRFLFDVVRQVELGPGGTAFVADARGRLIVHPNPSPVLKGSDEKARPLLQAAKGLLPAQPSDPITFQSTGLDGELVFASALRMPTTGWLLVVTQPAERLLADVRVSAVRLVLLLTATILAAFLASAWFARRLGDPILGLATQARELGRGNLDARSYVQTRDEVEELSTAMNQMAEALKRSTSNLEGLVAEKTRELQLANEHKSAFLANVSHELRTPLNAVIGFSEALEEELFGKLNDKQREYVADIKTSGLHLLALINDLLDLSKIEAGRMELDRAVFAVAPVLDGALNLVRSRALQGSVRLSLHAPAAIADFYGDARRMRQILLNLMSNAVKFTRPGGDVTLAVTDSPDMLTLTVTDTGVGIPAEELPRLFEPFTQASSGGDARAEGTGLGLALTKRLVELHGGTIDVTSEPGAGSTFTVHLPRTLETAPGGESS
jgi:signal transduction histidine kinase